MLKTNKDGKLVEFSLKQRDHWLMYRYENMQSNWPKLPRRDSPFPFVEQAPTMTISSPPKIKRCSTWNS